MSNLHKARSEMVKAGNPYKHGIFGRESYYTKLYYDIQDGNIVTTAKVDTGATYTVFGLKSSVLRSFSDRILKSNMRGLAYDASGTELRLYGYVVENFRLTDDIIIDKIKLFFSEDIGDRALLGMDILSLFDFQYIKEKRQNYGTFWINNYEDTLRELRTKRLNNDTNYIDPILIANVENEF